MEVSFTPEQEAELSRIASHNGIETGQLVQRAALRVLEEDALFRAAVRRGVSQADQGDFIDHEEMKARFADSFRS
jgi:predicted transcriptional regulator